MIKRIVSIIAAASMVFALSVFAFAHEAPDLNRKCSVTINMRYQDKAVPGGTLTIYKVADAAEDDGDYYFVYTEDFAGCEIPVTELDSSELPMALKKIAFEKRLAGTTANIDRNGQAKFENLEPGLYLVVQKSAAPGFNAVNPFLVSVPVYENGVYVYDTDASPKVELEPKPEEPEKPSEEPEKPDDKLPDTGLTSWPVPVMAVSGIILISAGIVLRRFERNSK
ncbi:MAG: hypothetical protein E7479_09100 [Ruminococcaceae bacterium]|nr:hypothetical protein [Oscillospiraceae bacterium]